MTGKTEDETMTREEYRKMMSRLGAILDHCMNDAIDLIEVCDEPPMKMAVVRTFIVYALRMAKEWGLDFDTIVVEEKVRQDRR